jgi:hypothetical protein
MATTIIGPYDFKVTGELQMFDEGTQQVVFTFKGGMIVEIPNPTQTMVVTLMQVGLNRLQYATINFVKGKIELNEVSKK